MTATAPKSVDVDISEEEVKGEISKVVNAMSKLRSETVRNRTLSPEQKDEYLHLAYRLASFIQGITDEKMASRMQVIADRLNRNELLMNYDPMQDEHWKRKEKSFARALDDLLIGAVGDDFHNLDARHHILQAVKYLAIGEAPTERREAVYDTIVPFQNPIQVKNDGILKSIAGKLFGASYPIKSADGLTLHLDALSGGFAPELLELARSRGYTVLKLDLPSFKKRKNRERLDELLDDEEISIPGAKLVDTKEIDSHPALYKIAGNIARFTKPLSSIILGALPESIQERLDKKMPNFDKASAFTWSCWSQILGGISAGITVGVKTGSTWYGIGTGAAITVDALIRGFWGMEATSNDLRYGHSVGSLFLKPFFFPIERYLNSRPSRAMVVEIPVRDIEAGARISNPSSFYASVATLDIPEEIERNLVWDTANHSQFGTAFLKYVESSPVWKQKPSDIAIKSEINRHNQSVIYNHTLDVGDFRKDSSLFVYNGRRFVLTAIYTDKSINFAERASVILLSEDANAKKIADLAKELDARYIHLREYRAKELVDELEGFGNGRD